MTRRGALRGAALTVVLGGALIALGNNGRQVLDHVHELNAPELLAAGAAVLAGLFANLLTWRAILADLGSPLPVKVAMRVFFLAQLGKYVPGSVWPVLAQMELGKQHGVPRNRSATVGLVTIAVSLVAGLLTAAATLPFTSAEALTHYWYGFLAIPLLGIGLLPAVANPVLDKLLRLTRRGTLESPLSARGMGVALGWALFSWVMFGLQVFLLAHALGADPGKALPLCIGAFALAWTLGFLVVVAPAGAGIREAALVVALAPVLNREEALLVALVSRLIMTAADVLLAGVTLLLTGRRRVVTT
jgi:uncharacterized membrane protein YbhN (UPF0104 family)